MHTVLYGFSLADYPQILIWPGKSGWDNFITNSQRAEFFTLFAEFFVREMVFLRKGRTQIKPCLSKAGFVIRHSNSLQTGQAEFILANTIVFYEA
jgi:hypothetical protein